MLGRVWGLDEPDMDYPVSAVAPNAGANGKTWLVDAAAAGNAICCRPMVEHALKKQVRNPADAMVVFGITGDLAFKKIFPSLYAMERRGVLNVPVVGVARPKPTFQSLDTLIRGSIDKSGMPVDAEVLDRLVGRCVLVTGTTETKTRSPASKNTWERPNARCFTWPFRRAFLTT